MNRIFWSLLFAAFFLNGQPSSATTIADVDTVRLDKEIRSMLDELFSQNEEISAKGGNQDTFQFDGIAWESSSGQFVGTSNFGVFLADRVERVLITGGYIPEDNEGLRSKGIFGDIFRGAYKVIGGGVKLTLGVVSGGSGNAISEVARVLDSSLTSNIARFNLLPPSYTDANGLGALIDASIGGQKSDFKLEISTDRGCYGGYVEGEVLTVFLEADQDCYVRLYHISGSEKKLAMVFPNSPDQSTFLPKAKVLAIPGEGDDFFFQTTAPFGVDALIAYASTAPIWRGDETYDDQGESDQGNTDSDIAEDSVELVSEADLNQENLDSVMSKGLIVRSRSELNVEGLSWSENGPALGLASQNPAARAVCFYTTIESIFR